MSKIDLAFVFCSIVLKLSIALCPLYNRMTLIWNVGQGQWITVVSSDRCEHYDFGGEKPYLNRIVPLLKKSCDQKTQVLHLSHADWDHYAFLSVIYKKFQNVCWQDRPPEKLSGEQFNIPFCSTPNHLNKKFLMSGKSKNDRSTVFIVKPFLLPGDSTRESEKRWIQYAKSDLKTIKILILGHHGSQTSTSPLLIKNLTSLKWALASARQKKYGHPHPKVAALLKQYHIPLLKTEDWGTILVN